MKKFYVFLLILFIPLLMITGMFFSYNYLFQDNFLEKEADQYSNDMKILRKEILMNFIYNFEKDVKTISYYPNLIKYFETNNYDFLNSFYNDLENINNIKSIESFQVFDKNDKMIFNYNLTENNLNLSQYEDGIYLIDYNGLFLIIINSLYENETFFGKIASFKEIKSIRGFNYDYFIYENIFLINSSSQIIYSSFNISNKNEINFFDSCFNTSKKYLYLHDNGFTVYSKLDDLPYYLAIDFYEKDYNFLFKLKNNYFILFSFILFISIIFYFLFFNNKEVVKRWKNFIKLFLFLYYVFF